jgi:voltage-gated sodium channel
MRNSPFKATTHLPGTFGQDTRCSPRNDRGMNFRTIAESSWFNALSIWIVVINAVLIGALTYAPEARWISLKLDAIVYLFIVELAIRFLGRRSTREFFADGWNLFDLILIIAAFLPESGELAPIVRVLRVFRVLRLVRTIPELRTIVTVLGKSVISMKWIGLLAFICFYVFALAGHKLFGQIQPAEFGSLHESLFTLFRLLTQDDWTSLRNAAVAEKGWIWPTTYHITWIILATFILINLVVGAIINNYQQVHDVEMKHERSEPSAEMPPMPTPFSTMLPETPEVIDARLRELASELQRLLAARAAFDAKTKQER